MTETKADSGVKVVDRRWWAREVDEAASASDAPAEPKLKPTYIEELERQIEAKNAEIQTLVAKYKSASTEFDEARARQRKEIGKEIERGRRTMLVELLDVLDNLDRALDSAPAREHDPVIAGVDLVRKQFLSKLEGFGVRRVDAMGAAFDPLVHEAIGTVPAPDPSQDGRIVGVVKPGYVIGDEVLRPALVAVARA